MAEIDHVERLVPEPYERRLLQVMLAARQNLADWNRERGGWREAAKLYGSIVELDPEAGAESSLLFQRGECLLMSGEPASGEILLERALASGLDPKERASAHAYLGRLCRERGDEAGVRRHVQDAEAVRGIPDDIRERIRRLKSP